jgi:hypothetical protein
LIKQEKSVIFPPDRFDLFFGHHRLSVDFARMVWQGVG